MKTDIRTIRETVEAIQKLSHEAGTLTHAHKAAKIQRDLDNARAVMEAREKWKRR